MRWPWSWAAAQEPWLCLREFLCISRFLFSFSLQALLPALFSVNTLSECRRARQKSLMQSVIMRKCNWATGCLLLSWERIHTWVKYLLFLNTSLPCLLRSDFVGREDVVSPVWTKGKWAAWKLCPWKVKVCLGTKCSSRFLKTLQNLNEEEDGGDL